MPVPSGDTDTASSSTLEVSDVTSDRLEVINSGRAAPPATVFLTAALLPERNLPNTRRMPNGTLVPLSADVPSRVV